MADLREVEKFRLSVVRDIGGNRVSGFPFFMFPLDTPVLKTPNIMCQKETPVKTGFRSLYIANFIWRAYYGHVKYFNSFFRRLK